MHATRPLRSLRSNAVARRLTPVAFAVLLSVGDASFAQQAFSPAWFANRNAVQGQATVSGRLPDGRPASVLTQSLAQQQRAREKLDLSVSTLRQAAQSIAAQQAAQAAARQAARNQPGTVADGLGEGGLKVDTNSLTAGWLNAKGPTQTVDADGKTTVVIAQTADRAILNWETFNVGRNTLVDFDQQPSWSVLNRVNDPNARPSQIQGQIKADGTVLIVNRNGIVFNGSSQVDTRNLVAAAVGMSDAQFKKGLYSETLGNGFLPTFGNDLVAGPTTFTQGPSTGDVVVEAGARIATPAPSTVTEGGGYVMLLGQEVHNHGTIATPNGQAVLAAGDAFVIRKGVGTEENKTSTTRGSEVTALRMKDGTSTAGAVSNTGLIQATTGDITLTGHDVRQDGTLVATTSVNTRGTVHLLNDAADPQGHVALGSGSLTAILLDETATTALDVQRETLVKDSDKVGNGIAHRRDQSLVQITSGGDVDFEGGSSTLATGGQVFVDAAGTSRVADRATIDVAGALGVVIAMEANNVLINVQGNEQRDASGNRDTKNLNNSNIWLDRRDLVLVPAGTNGYETDRWYTAGGLLEVGGYLGITGHGIGEWSAQGGTVQFGGGAVVTERGSSLNLSGGTLDVQTGFVSQTFLKGADGKLYNASTAPGDLLYTGLYKGYETTHARWGSTGRESFYNPLIAPSQRLENGYTVGRDAGKLVVATQAAVLDGDITSTTFQGDRQQRARDTLLDGYAQAQTAVARGGQLVIGSQTPVLDKDTNELHYRPGAVVDDVTIGSSPAGGSPRAGHISLDAAWLDAQNLGALQVYAAGRITVDGAVKVAAGGDLALHASDVSVHADLTARGGSIRLGDILLPTLANDPSGSWSIGQNRAGGVERQVVVDSGVTLDARGLWTNAQLGGEILPFVDGGSVHLRSSGSIRLGEGSLIDVSSGAALGVDDKLAGGRGGNVTLAAGQALGNGVLEMNGAVRGHGVKGGGTLDIEHGTLVSIGGALPQAVEQLAAGEVSTLPLRLAGDFVIQPGEVIPITFSVTVTHVAGGKPMPVRVRPLVTSAQPVTLRAPWLVPVTVVTADNTYVYAGTVLPAGTVLSAITELNAGYVVPVDAFPNGLPIPEYISHYTAGKVATTAIVMPAGTRVPAGTALLRDVAVQPFLALDEGLFQTGFKQYRVTGRDGVVVVDGADLAVAMPVLQVDRDAARRLATGEDPSGALTVALPTLQQDHPGEGRVTLRQGASLTLNAGTVTASGNLHLGEGSRIAVDPGQSITLTSNGQVTLEGTLEAHGGRISVLGSTLGLGNDVDVGAGTPNGRSFWIGDRAVLDVSGQAFTGVDGNGRRFGQVLDGGTIEVGAKHELGARGAGAPSAFLVVREGARLDASGAQAVLDLPGLGETTVASDGGAIALSSGNGLFIDGTLRAAAGGAGALGGTLALNLETPVYGGVDRFGLKGAGVDDAVRVPRELVIEQTYGGSGLAKEAVAGELHDTLVYGKARYGVDAIHAGGFDTASLLVNGLLSFDGNTDLHMGQALYLTASGIGLSATGARDSQVHFAAPYLRLSGSSARQGDNTIMPNPVFGSKNISAANGTLGVPFVADASALTLSGNFVDIVGEVGMGARGDIVLNAATPRTVERDAFGNVRIESQGDLRLRDAVFFSPGNTTLAATQVYGSGKVTVGLIGDATPWGTVLATLDADRHLDIERTGPVPTALPYSVFGTMTFISGTINQGGVLRAPLGSITLGEAGGALSTSTLNLLPGSVTSVSADGLVMPYGGTVDGLVYNFNGVDVRYQGIGNEPKVELKGREVNAQAGAVVDLSGGGELAGAAFLSGRGGSTDVRLNPLVQMGEGAFVLPTLATNPVYAIVPGVQAGLAPVGLEKGAGDPAIGRQITIGAGVPGLPAGSYTLLPSTYALMPGAFRVELNGLAGSGASFGNTTAMRNGSWSTAAQLGSVTSGARDVLPTQAIFTPADTVRTYSQYNETSYAEFALALAAREGVPRPLLERDAKALNLALATPTTADVAAGPALVFEASVKGTPAKGGSGTVTRLLQGTEYEILADGAERTEGFTGVSVHASALNATNPSRLEIGGTLRSTYTNDVTGSVQYANVISTAAGGTRSIVLREGALLEAADVFLMTGRVDGGITIEQGAGISTLGQGESSYGAAQGYIYQPGRTSVLALSNGRLDLLAPQAPDTEGNGAGTIQIGVCTIGDICRGDTRLYSEGTIATATDNQFVLGESVRYGTRNLALALGGVNVGTAAALEAASAGGTLPSGLTLNQDLLDRLLLGDTAAGVPALESLAITARDSVNFYGDVTLSTYDTNGKSVLKQMVLGTPALYGHGDADTVARIHTDTLVWTGSLAPAGAIVADGPGTGAGQLVVDAREIVFGPAPRAQADSVRTHDRVAIGFSDVHLNASERVTATDRGTLAVYESQGAWDPATNGYTPTGGNLFIQTPVLTGNAGSVNKITAGGDIRVTGTPGATPPTNAAVAGALGAEVALDSRGGDLVLDTAVLLPSGKLTLAAQGDVTLADGAQLDLAGRKIDFYDVSRYSWGGDVVLESRTGDVRQAAGAAMDLSAVNNRAGKLGAFAAAGEVALVGQIDGSASGHYDAGGTAVPYAAGRIDVRAQTIADFTGLNTRLTADGVTGGRSFQLGQGDLVIGSEVKAHEVNVSVDNGHLTVNGTIDASGEQAGSIRLAAKQGVTLAGTAVLDASADVLRRDSYGLVIDAPNRAVIEVDAGTGTLTLASGVRLDLRVAGSTTNHGTVALNAPRVGGNDVAIDASGAVTIDGAKSIQVNAFVTDRGAATGTETTTDGKTYQVIDKAYLDRLHGESAVFIDAALGNSALMTGKLAGLRGYADQFHLRPGVEIVADTRTGINPDGNLHVDGDLDLSGYRYASVNPNTPRTGVRGSGEAGALVVRAQGDLHVFGSISDGFDGDRLTTTFDDTGWLLTKGQQLFGSDVVVPHGGLVTLADGTIFNSGKVLNYDLPIHAMQMAAGTQLPAAASLASPLDLPAGTVLSAAVYDASGQLLHAAGSVLSRAVTLPQGASFAAGFRLPANASIAAMTWPAGVALPAPPRGNAVVLSRDLALNKGALIPSDTDIKLPGGVESVDLRPRDADGNQGRIWALAPMLPGGSQSWDITLVAGADTGAADRLSVARHTTGSLRFSDAHYGMGARQVPIPGTGSPAVMRYADEIPAYFLETLAMYAEWGYEVPDMVPGAPVGPRDEEMLLIAGLIWDSMTNLNEYGVGDAVQVLTPATPPDMEFRAVPAREQLPSVIRTGTGDLRLASGRDIETTSLFGIYTAGTPSASLAAAGAADPYNLARSTRTRTPTSTDIESVLGPAGAPFEHLVDGGTGSLYEAWYPEAGGNLLLRAEGNISGDSIGRPGSMLRPGELGAPTDRAIGTASVSNWLWRQGTGSVASGDGAVPTAWWINFGTYVRAPEGFEPDTIAAMPRLVGFTGFGTLGGGNVVLESGGDAGMLKARGDHGGFFLIRSAGLNLAVASTGRVTPKGDLVLTGGGDLDIRIGGGLNADPELRSFSGTNFEPEAAVPRALDAHRLDVNGSFTNLRGALRLEAGAVGGIELRHGVLDAKDSRPNDVFNAGYANAAGGPVLVLGDAAARLDARGDLVLGSVTDPGRASQLQGGTPFSAEGASFNGGGFSWFSLWTPSTAVDLLAAGGNLTPTMNPVDPKAAMDARPTDGNFIYPSVLRAAAASRNVYYGNRNGLALGVVLAPSPVSDRFAVSGTGQLELLAAGSLYANGSNFSASGADPTALPSPFNPGFVGMGEQVWYGRHYIHNVSPDALAPLALVSTASHQGISGDSGSFPLFSFTPPTASGHVYPGQDPARYYAVDGDLVGLRFGSIVFRGNHTGVPGTYPTWYDGGGAVAVRAGRDIVNAGSLLGSYDNLGTTYGYASGSFGWLGVKSAADPAAPARPYGDILSTARGNLVVHTSPDDVSVVQAGRDIRLSTFSVAGPGLLDVSAGRDLYLAQGGELRSLGPVYHVTPGDRSSGAGISVAAGMGRYGADWKAFSARYLDPANLADPTRPFADQPGKAVRTYAGAITLTQWLAREFGYTGDDAGALEFMAGRQAALDRVRADAIARGATAANRSLAREFKLEAQLHLVNWLTDRFGGANGRGLHFDAATMDAREFFAALAPEQQAVFLRNVYFAELRASGREYNQVDGPREGSYLRGREAIATLLPSKDAGGKEITYQGDLTMFSSAMYYDQYVNANVTRRPQPGVTYIREDEWVALGSPGYDVPFYKVNDAGIHTNFGGDINVMVPGGRTLVGVDGGFVPAGGSGLLTQGEGDINIYSLGSVLMGQSRIFTTFGGNILAWAAEGDINAGRGAKTTVVYTPSRRVYDDVGNVMLSPTTPTTGAGIATLNPIPEVPPGDIDLIAPLGTIDAGEAGIRVSGNVNLAALHVVNAENIQVQGEAVGIPMVAAVNIGALTNASAAATQATAAAQEVLQRERASARQAQPSVVNVRVLGFGDDQGAAAPDTPKPATGASSSGARNAVEVVGDGALTAEQRAALTATERRNWRP
jgi:filamentous hemagglutinin family protein